MMLFLTGDISGGDWARLEFEVTPWDDPDYYREISPLTYARDIRTPLLIQHCERDLRTTIGQAEALFTVLRSCAGRSACCASPRTPTSSRARARRSGGSRTSRSCAAGSATSSSRASAACRRCRRVRRRPLGPLVVRDRARGLESVGSHDERPDQHHDPEQGEDSRPRCRRGASPAGARCRSARGHPARGLHRRSSPSSARGRCSGRGTCPLR